MTIRPSPQTGQTCAAGRPSTASSGSEDGLGRDGLGRRRDAQQCAAQRQLLPAHPVGQEAVVPDPHEPRRQHVQEEPADELDRLQGHRLWLSPVGVVLPAERDLVVLRGRPAGWLLIATRWVYRARYFSTCSGPPNGGLAYTTHSVSALAASRRRNSPGSASAASLPWKESCPRSKAARSSARNLPRKTRLRTRTGRKKPGRQATQREPSGDEPAARDDAVDVGVVLEVLAPGVEDGQEADLGPEVLGVGGDLLQGLGGGAEQEAVDHPWVLQGDRAERRRESEDDVEVLDRAATRLPGPPSTRAAAVAWHLGQWRLRHEL